MRVVTYVDRGTPNTDQVQDNTSKRQWRRTVTHVQCWCGVSKLVLPDAQYFERESDYTEPLRLATR